MPNTGTKDPETHDSKALGLVPSPQCTSLQVPTKIAQKRAPIGPNITQRRGKSTATLRSDLNPSTSTRFNIS